MANHSARRCSPEADAKKTLSLVLEDDKAMRVPNKLAMCPLRTYFMHLSLSRLSPVILLVAQTTTCIYSKRLVGPSIRSTGSLPAAANEYLDLGVQVFQSVTAERRSWYVVSGLGVVRDKTGH